MNQSENNIDNVYDCISSLSGLSSQEAKFYVDILYLEFNRGEDCAREDYVKREKIVYTPDDFDLSKPLFIRLWGGVITAYDEEKDEEFDIPANEFTDVYIESLDLNLDGSVYCLYVSDFETHNKFKCGLITTTEFITCSMLVKPEDIIINYKSLYPKIKTALYLNELDTV